MKNPFRRIAFKNIFVIVIILAVFASVIGFIGYSSFETAMLEQYTDGAFRVAETAALDIDADRMDEYEASNGKGIFYQAAWRKLDTLCNSSGSTFIYVIRPDRTDYAHIIFLFSTIRHGSPYSVYPFRYVRETTNEEYKVKYRKLYDGLSKRESVLRVKGYIETDAHITAMIPLTGSDGKTQAILCVQRQMDYLMRARNEYYRRVITVLVILTLIVIIGMGIYLNRMLIRPVRRITSEASRFASENVTSGKKLTEQIRNRDEIGLLAQSIDQMEEQISSYVDNLTRTTAEKERIATELQMGTQIQASMLPGKFPAFPDRSEFDIFAAMFPAREVGGDFYDFFLIDEDHLYLSIADVSGKGVPAALFMMAVKILFANNAMSGKSPARNLDDTNTAICSNNSETMFVTVWMGILEISTGRLIAANAGHEYPMIARAGENFELLMDKHGFVIGGMENMKYTEYEIRLKPGDRLFLYTDGVPEATSVNDELFGTERTLDALNRDLSASPEEVLKNVRTAVDVFVEGAEQFDDITMFCLEYKGTQREEKEE